MDTHIDIRLNHRQLHSRLPSGRDRIGIADKDIDLHVVRIRPGLAAVQHLNLIRSKGDRRIAGFTVLGAFDVLDLIDDAVDRLTFGRDRSQKRAGKSNMRRKAMKKPR